MLLRYHRISASSFRTHQVMGFLNLERGPVYPRAALIHAKYNVFDTITVRQTSH